MNNERSIRVNNFSQRIRHEQVHTGTHLRTITENTSQTNTANHRLAKETERQASQFSSAPSHWHSRTRMKNKRSETHRGTAHSETTAHCNVLLLHKRGCIRKGNENERTDIPQVQMCQTIRNDAQDKQIQEDESMMHEWML